VCDVAWGGIFNGKKETRVSFRTLAPSSSPDGQGSLTQGGPNEHYYVCTLLRHQANPIEMLTLGEGIHLRLLERHSLARSVLAKVACFSRESDSLRSSFSQIHVAESRKLHTYLRIMTYLYCTLMFSIDQCSLLLAALTLRNDDLIQRKNTQPESFLNYDTRYGTSPSE
jgi:hypothetical protein